MSKLEIDHSLRVSDAVVPDMLKLGKLVLLSMAGDDCNINFVMCYLIVTIVNRHSTDK